MYYGTYILSRRYKDCIAIAVKKCKTETHLFYVNTFIT